MYSTVFLEFNLRTENKYKLVVLMRTSDGVEIREGESEAAGRVGVVWGVILRISIAHSEL